ncbi:hypothetical protein ATO6_05490 [Oceanicola sp. 22II-s10i]|uniref:LPS export ABC transporter periplasmic protein LptC n=1 Tax=Oceanicola sp. 22II-s10i TaxID=1317116 RepID=UPI000B724E1B|nr:LPS export ABC transporter periplasmic protein LptC [Oceanicola sp. 22II-s10i]OWU86793.1 hypothetical protein ATO6_05490 [Oceanicola sp. 22II-s10i]
MRDLRSRVVGVLGIALPVAALSLLTGLFLFARKAAPPDDLPFGQSELETRAERQQVTLPSVAGATARGDLIELTANEILPDPTDPQRLSANGIAAAIDMVDGTAIRFRADSAEVDRGRDIAALRGAVTVSASTGHDIRTEEIEIVLSTLEARATGPVTAQGPEGTVTAGGMVLQPTREGNDAHLVFMRGVKLVYVPDRSKDRP